MKKWILLVLGLFLYISLTTLAFSEPVNKLDIICCSYHFERVGYNESNFGIKYKRQYTSTESFFIGGYNNSEYGTSYIIGYNKKWKLSESFDISLDMGLVTGYERDPILPYALPALSYKDTVHLHFVPVSKGGVGLSFTVARWSL